MLLCKGFLRIGWLELCSPQTRQQGNAISTPLPQALTNLSEKNSATKGSLSHVNQILHPAPYRPHPNSTSAFSLGQVPLRIQSIKPLLEKTSTNPYPYEVC